MLQAFRSLAVSMFIIALLSAGPFVRQASAHKGAGEPLFIAEDGIDRGRCLEEASPCRTIGYALSVAGKGAEIRLAEGTYEVDDPEDLFHIVSGMIEVSGGFKQSGRRFHARNGTSTLTGVPPRFRELLRNRGLNVVSDRKAIDGRKAAEAEKLVALHAQLKAGAPASPCSGGKAGNLDCNKVDLLSHFSFTDVSATPRSATDVWGFVDLNTGREYALVGYDIGTAVVDVSDPETPREVGFVDGQPAFWRDIKVYQFFDTGDERWRTYAYVTTDGSTDGLFAIDLSGLPHSIRKESYSSEYRAAHNVYATNTDYSTGISLSGDAPLLVIAGSSLGAGQYRAYSLEDPAAPAFVAGAGSSDYMHDASSLIITDSRKDTQCDNATAWCEVLLDFNETTIDIWDITSPATPSRLSRTPYANASYVHSGWWSEDRQHILVHDELDEQNLGLNTTVRVFSIANLRNPVLVGEWQGPSRAIDHNGFVRGNRYYISNYAKGLTVLDITDVAAPVTVGSLDTYPFSDTSSFVGAWGTYPFFFSGTIAVSDIDSGLYLTRDRSIEVPEGRLSFEASSYAGDEGDDVELVVQRSGGAAGDASVDLEIVHATAGAQDYQVQAGTLAWADGDDSARTITLSLVEDAEAENLERLLVRLVNPGGGATLDRRNVASVFIGDRGRDAEVGFFAHTIDIAERGFGTAVLVLQRSVSAADAASVDFSVNGNEATPGTDFDGPSSGTISWNPGDGEPKTIVFSIADDGSSEETESFTVTLTNPVGAGIRGAAMATVNIANGRGFNVAPNAVAGASQTVPEGAVVQLDGSQSNDPDGDSLTFQWEQVSGEPVSLSNASAAMAEFTAPSVSSDTMLQFRLTVTDPAGLSDSANAVVTVAKPGGSGSGGGGGGGGGSVSLLLLAVVAAALFRRRYRRDAA